MLKNVQQKTNTWNQIQPQPKLAIAPAQQQNQPKSGQLSGKYYRTRSLSQNLQQIFHPHRQSHSRSINNLSNVGAVGAVGAGKSSSKIVLKVPQSLPQSPRILVDSSTSPFFPILQIPSLNFLPPTQATNTIYPMFNFTQPTTVLRISEPTTSKLKGFKLGEFRKNQYTRTLSNEEPMPPKLLEKRFSWEEGRKLPIDRYQINDVVRENTELLRKYSDPKVQPISYPESGASSLTLLQTKFKTKLASLFKNKKKYTIAEPPSNQKENFEAYDIHRCESCHSLPTLSENRKNVKQKNDKKERKSLRQMKKSSLGRCQAEGKLKSLNLNPPQMFGGSFDNLLLLHRMNQKRRMMGTYDTYHGRPLISQSARLKSLMKYRKPSESDDATTLSYDYDSGDMSDNSSIERSSSGVDEDSSSFSDLTTKSSSYGYKIRSSASIHSMPQMKQSRNKLKKSPTLTMHSPNRSLESQFTSLGNRVAQHSNSPVNPKSIPYHLTHQMSAPALNSRSDSFTMPMMQQQPSFGQFTKPNYYSSLSMPSTGVHVNQNPNQMIKAFFTSGPASSNEFPLVSLLSLTQKNKRIG